MEVKIGIPTINREVVVESDEPAEALETRLAEALSADALFTLRDPKGRIVMIPAAKIAYVDLGSEHARPVGFGAV